MKKMIRNWGRRAGEEKESRKKEVEGKESGEINKRKEREERITTRRKEE